MEKPDLWGTENCNLRKDIPYKTSMGEGAFDRSKFVCSRCLIVCKFSPMGSKKRQPVRSVNVLVDVPGSMR